MRRALRRRAILAAVLAAVLVTACAPHRTPGRAAVRIAVLPFLSYAPLFIAADQGLFAARGIDVELVQIGTTEGAVALARGDVDAITNYLTAGVFNLMHRGARMRIVADKGHEAPGACVANGLVARRGLLETGALSDTDSLRGLRLDIRTGHLEEYWVDVMLGKMGLSLADFELHRVPQPAKLEALRSGGIEIATWSEPYITQAAEAGVADVWVGVGEVVPDLQWAFLMYGRSLLDERPETGESLMAAYLEGVARYREGKTQRNVAAIARHTGLDAETVRRACWIEIRGDGRIDIDSVLGFQRWAVARGYQDAVVPPEGFWAPRFAARAAARLAAERDR